MYIVAGLLMIFMDLSAQNVKFSVEISDDTLLVGNYFELKYTIQNVSPNGFQPPTFTDLEVVGGPNTATSFSIINGEMSQSASFTYYIRPPETGAYTIPPAYVADGDQEMETPPIDIYVLPNPDGIIKQPHQAGITIDQIQAEPSSKGDQPAKRPRKKF